ncbi:hypothetical protein WJX72_000702 [[Myrmecia] bisecta]|uniref:DNA topoisomerase n=1 Tax=[Myrmecia] bisecta TaxID=41462 RepID=A0AAW1PFA0_9CHLO
MICGWANQPGDVLSRAASVSAAQQAGKHKVVVVESPAKAKKIQQFLGGDYVVLASYGHVRDLLDKPGSVQPDSGFAMTWSVDPKAQGRLDDIAQALQNAEELILATDPDREGEAIAWHIQELLQAQTKKQGIPVQRITFTSVTKAAVLDALRKARQVSLPLVNAYRARRALDYLVGFHVAPVLWQKLRGTRSAGRVQSVALRLVCERDAQIDTFVMQPYWLVEGVLATTAGKQVQAHVTHVDGSRLGKLPFLSEEQATAVVQRVTAAGNVEVADKVIKQVSRNPPPPYITSTLQQDAFRKYGFGSARTMRLAQELYEGLKGGSDGGLISDPGDTEGLITYPRTDGVNVSPEAADELMATALQLAGEDLVPDELRVYKSKSKNAQEAHEAIRPTDPSRLPSELPASASAAHVRLYDMIWRRSVASQMASAQVEQIRVDMTTAADSITLRASSSKFVFPGFKALDELVPPITSKLPAASEIDADSSDSESEDKGEDEEASADGSGDDEDAPSGDSQVLFELQVGDRLAVERMGSTAHSTKPSGRYTEGSLVKALEERGIGRPSTYAPIIKLLQERGYVAREGRSLQSSSRGRVLTHYMATFFPVFMDYGYTSGLEAQLDDVSGGSVVWTDVLKDFWDPFFKEVASAQGVSTREVIDALDPLIGDELFPNKSRRCPKCADGRLGLKLSQHGGFVGCSNYPACDFSATLAVEEEGSPGQGPGTTPDAVAGPRVLGTDPDSGLPVTLRLGPYGSYVQLGGEDAPTASAEPASNSAPTATESGSVGTPLEELTLEDALALLRFPRELGQHDGAAVLVKLGRYGPYIEHKGATASIPKAENLDDLDLTHALELVARQQAKQAAKAAKQLVSLGPNLLIH